MNPKLKLALLRSRSTEQGAILPVILGMGLVMTLAGMTMIIRSSDEQTTAISQNQTAQALAAAEAGISRTLSILNEPQNAFYLDKNFSAWATAASTYGSFDPCRGHARSSGTPVTYNNLVSQTLSSGATYEIKDYQYNSVSREGTLLIEGKDRGAASRIEVKSIIDEQPITGTFPALFANNIINLGGNSIAGNANEANVVCTNCTPPNPATHCNSSGQLNQAGLGHSLGGNNQASVAGSSYFGTLSVEGVPTAPIGATTLSSINGNKTLPNDEPATLINGAYHYVVPSINLGGSDNLTINTTASAQVYLYVSGNITMSGSGNIVHTGQFGRFRIYGNPDDGNNTTISQTIRLNGSPSAADNIFIYAPDANAGINGNATLNSVMWVQQWGLSSGQGIINVPNGAAGLLSEFNAGVEVDKPSAVSSWQRKGI